MNAATQPMPTLHAVRIFLKQRRILVWALLLSAALHIWTYLITPYFIHGWHEMPVARFDAVIVPERFAEPPQVAAATPPAKRPSRPKVVRAPARRAAPQVKSTADFVAPENAIAVAPSQPASEETQAATGKQDDAAPANGGAATSTTDPVASSSEAPMPAPAPAPTPAPAPAELPPKIEKIETPAVELPSRISLAYQMSSSISDGVANYSWKRDGQQFEIDSSMQATGFLVGNFVGVLHQVSNGEMTPAGLKPISFRIRRGDVVPDNAEFNYGANELKMTRGNGQIQTIPLPPNLQDIQSFLFQLAFDAPKLQNTEDTLDVMVTNARKVYRHRFRQVGPEVVRTRSGPVQTIHLRSEAADPEDVYEVWLAPGNFHLPVKLKFYAGRFPVELIATSIRTTP